MAAILPQCVKQIKQGGSNVKMFPCHDVIIYASNKMYPDTWSPFNEHGLTLIPAWITNYIHYKVWGEITDPFPNFNSPTIEV